MSVLNKSRSWSNRSGVEGLVSGDFSSGRGKYGRWLCLALVLLATGCATPPSDPLAQAEFYQLNDPLEPTNRYFYHLNRGLDHLAARPAAVTYRTLIPRIIRGRVAMVLENASEPSVFINTLLQGRFLDGAVTLTRFLINTTIGLGGIFDIATAWSLERREADFGQTLYTYSVPAGPYLMLPLLGPSNPRDAVGQLVDGFLDPLNLFLGTTEAQEIIYLRRGVSVVSGREASLGVLDELERGAIDAYAQIRSVSRQQREAFLRGSEPDSGAATGLGNDFYDLDGDFYDEDFSDEDFDDEDFDELDADNEEPAT